MLHQFKASIECEAYIQEPCLQRLWPQSSSNCRKEGSRVAEQQIPQSTLDPLPKLHAFTHFAQKCNHCTKITTKSLKNNYIFLGLKFQLAIWNNFWREIQIPKVNHLINVIWGHLRSFEAIWGHLRPFETIWGHLRPKIQMTLGSAFWTFKDFRGHLRPSEAVWGRLKLQKLQLFWRENSNVKRKIKVTWSQLRTLEAIWGQSPKYSLKSFLSIKGHLRPFEAI